MNRSWVDEDELLGTNDTGPGENQLRHQHMRIDNVPGIVRALPKCFYAICIIGILLNIGVFWQRKTTSRKQSSTTRLSLSLLCTMAAADTISLSALLFMLCSQYFGFSPTLMTILCKLDVFFIHAASAFSLWCWLVLSAVRYVAIYRPYSHLTLRKEPMVAVIGVAILCSVLEVWILAVAVFDEQAGSCTESIDASLSKPLHLFEISWSYFIPLFVITFLDVKVLCCRSVWFTGLATSQLIDRPSATYHKDSALHKDSSFHKQNSLDKQNSLQNDNSLHKNSYVHKDSALHKDNSLHRALHKDSSLHRDSASTVLEKTIRRARSNRRVLQLKVLRRCLCITILDLAMNLPNYISRLYVNISSDEQLYNISYSMMVFEAMSQLLYFAQFACNAVYLACIIYDAPKQTADSSAVRMNHSASRFSSNGLNGVPRKNTNPRCPSITQPIIIFDSGLQDDPNDDLIAC